MLSRRTLARHLHINQLMRKNSVGNRLTIKQFAICHLLRRKTWPIARQNTAFRTAVCRVSQNPQPLAKGTNERGNREIPIKNMDIHLQKHDECIIFAA